MKLTPSLNAVFLAYEHKKTYFSDRLPLITVTLMSSCGGSDGGYYKASYAKVPHSKEQITLQVRNDFFLGSHRAFPDWIIVYPTSSRNKITNVVKAKDFTLLSADHRNRLDSIEGYIIVNPSSTVEIRFTDASSLGGDFPVNGIHILPDNKEIKPIKAANKSQ